MEPRWLVWAAVAVATGMAGLTIYVALKGYLHWSDPGQGSDWSDDDTAVQAAVIGAVVCAPI